MISLVYLCLCFILLFLMIRFFMWLFSPIISWMKGDTNKVYDSEKTFYDPQSEEYHEFPSLNDPATIDLSIVIPAYNEENRMRSMLDATIHFLKEREEREKSNSHVFTWEIIIVDDGSRDNTKEIGYEYSKEYGVEHVRVLVEDHNRGKGAAVKWGMLRSRGKYCLMADADGATKIEDEEALEAYIVREKGHIAVGSRKVNNEETGTKRSPLRLFFMNGFHLCVEILSGIRNIRDTQCGFKLFSREAARVLFNTLHIYRWAFDIELLIIASQMNYNVKEVAVHWEEVPGSKVSIISASITMLRDMAATRFAYLIGLWTIDSKQTFKSKSE
ncbi:hypothetical protein WA158_002924 [Blastocystis sp. Blastoise]